MKVSDLREYVSVDWWSETNQNGYQRPLFEDRIDKAIRYLLNEDGLFPTSILVNVRGEVIFYPATSIDSYAELGVLEIPENSLPLWIIDGQHRVWALFFACKEDPKFENYAIPVSILNFNDKYDEMRQFFIVNDRQKRVRTDLAQRHLYKTILKKGEVDLIGFESKEKILAAEATPVVDFLRLHPNSQWYNKIQIPSNRKREKYHIIAQTSLSKSIGYILREFTRDERESIMKTPKILGDLLISYWNALKEIYPEAFNTPKNYKLQKTFGCYVFNMLFPHIYKKCLENDDDSEEFMKEILLEMLFDFNDRTDSDATSSAFWHGAYGHSMTRGSGMQVIRKLVKEFIEYF